jgi:GH18 family chitinase
MVFKHTNINEDITSVHTLFIETLNNNTMKIKLRLITALSLLLFSYSLQAQHVIGFFPNWRAAGDENKIQYDKITDIIYCFIQPNASGQFPAFNTWSSADQTKFNNIKTKAKTKNVRVRISSGGAGSAGIYSPIAANATYRQNFATTVADFIVANDIDGFDIDWEFPSPSEVGNLDLLVAAFKTAFNAKESAGYRKIYLGIDVGGEQAHTTYFSKNFVNYVDEVNIMAYDLAGGFSTTALSKKSFDIWKTYLGAGNASKLVLGIPFYTVGGGNMYSGVAWPYSTNAANAYNGTLSGSDGSTYNAAPSIKDKIDYTMQNGGSGVMIWELSQDILDPTYYQYSLLTAVNNAIKPYMGPSCSKPNMGGNKSLCGTGGSVTIASGLSAQSYRTFTWYKNGVVIGGNTASITATAAGTYTVKVDSAGKCNTKDSIVVSATIGTVNLGSAVALCTPSTKLLDAGLTGAGFTYQWSKDAVVLPGETNQSYLARRPGNYSVTVGAAGCSNVSGSVTVSSTLPDVADVARCNAGTVTLTVNNPGSDTYEWYNAETNGTLLHTGSTFTTPSISQTTNYYVVKKAGAVGASCAGVPIWDANTIYGTVGQPYDVVYNNTKYTAQWWTKGDTPGTNSVWINKGSCGIPGCDRMLVVATVNTCTGVDELGENTTDLSVYPNPTKDVVYLNFNALASENVQVSIVPLNGNHTILLFSGIVKKGSNHLEINLPNVNPGLYLLKINGLMSNISTKLVIE